jgi:hypothetical protein
VLHVGQTVLETLLLIPCGGSCFRVNETERHLKQFESRGFRDRVYAKRSTLVKIQMLN